ncbi:Uncharacterised protein [Cronobacter sakazakii]|nr:Uncharacterised protein [Cronobacter sakazakii]
MVPIMMQLLILSLPIKPVLKLLKKDTICLMVGKLLMLEENQPKQKNILSKPNEPGARGIGSDMIDDFNKHIKSVSVEEIQKCKKKRKR